MRCPNIVCLEGIDGSAKSTHAALLADYLDTLIDPVLQRSSVNGIETPSPLFKPCFRVKFPNYETPTGKLILLKLQDKWGLEMRPRSGADEQTWGEMVKSFDHANALVLQSLMLTNRFEVADEIERAVVVEGRNVVLDRYSPSAFAYGMADGLDYKWIESIHTRLPKAHCVFIDIPVEESFKRRPERTDAYEANKDRLSKARANYLHLFERMGVDTSYWQGDVRTSASGYSIVNGLGTIDQVQERIRKVLEL